MNIVGITGAIGHGKSSFADAITELEPATYRVETGDIIIEVADRFHQEMPHPPRADNIAWMNRWLFALPNILRDVVQVETSYDQIAFSHDDVISHPIKYQKFFEHAAALVDTPELAETPISSNNKLQNRPLLQWLGGYLIERVSPTIWQDEVYRRVAAAGNNAAPLVLIGGIRYPSDADAVSEHGGVVVKISRPDVPEQDTADPTESQRSTIRPDVTVVNNGSLADLSVMAGNFVQDMKRGKPRALYIAAS